ncbi:MAG: DoxX family protein [Candidatus Baltobacteraceae bacterium]
MDLAFLLIRLLLGAAIAAHGSQKLFGWFGGPGLTGAAGFFEQLGFRPGRLFVFGAAGGEIAGGVLTALGIGGALGPAIIVMVMLVAILAVHVRAGFFAQAGGWELSAFYISNAVAVAFAGSGAYSLDRVLGLNILDSPTQVTIALAVAAVLALLNLSARRGAPAREAA